MEFKDGAPVYTSDGKHIGSIDRLVLACVQTRGIHKNHLHMVQGLDPQQAMPGGLGFPGRDAYFLADEKIQQGGFPDVGFTDDGNQAATGGRWCGLLGSFGIHGGNDSRNFRELTQNTALPRLSRSHGGR